VKQYFNGGMILILAMVLLFTCGCSSIFCGAQKSINIKSKPEGAQFSILNKKGEAIAKGTTPTMITLKRGRGYFAAGDYRLTLSAPGYQDVNVPIKQGVEWGWYGFGNALIGGLIGWVIVDPLTGGMYTIEDVNVEMQKQEALLNPEERPLCYKTTNRQLFIPRLQQ
jgi:hypothetical protein